MTLQQDSTHPTGVSDDTPKGNSDVARARERKAHSAIQLRRDGYTWEQIAEYLGYPTARMALVATEKALENELQTQESQVFMRKLAGDRLERVLRPVMKKAVDPNHPEHLAAVETVRRLVRDHSELFGYIAPKQRVNISPSASQIEALVSKIINAGGDVPEEGDIFGEEEPVELEEGPDGVLTVKGEG